MKAFLRPRITIRRVMLFVAIAAILMAYVPPLWVYWFGSPIRKLVVQWPGVSMPRYSGTSYLFDVRHPAAAKELERIRSQVQDAGIAYRIERSQANPEDPIGTPSSRPAK